MHARRSVYVVPTLIVGLLSGVLLGSATPTANQDGDVHAIVGSWRYDQAATEAQVDMFYTFFADGNLIATDAQGTTMHGTWAPLDDDAVTFVVESFAEQGGGQGFSAELSLGENEDVIEAGGDRFTRITI